MTTYNYPAGYSLTPMPFLGGGIDIAPLVTEGNPFLRTDSGIQINAGDFDFSATLGLPAGTVMSYRQSSVEQPPSGAYEYNSGGVQYTYSISKVIKHYQCFTLDKTTMTVKYLGAVKVTESYAVPQVVVNTQGYTNAQLYLYAPWYVNLNAVPETFTMFLEATYYTAYRPKTLASTSRAAAVAYYKANGNKMPTDWVLRSGSGSFLSRTMVREVAADEPQYVSYSNDLSVNMLDHYSVYWALLKASVAPYCRIPNTNFAKYNLPRVVVRSGGNAASFYFKSDNLSGVDNLGSPEWNNGISAPEFYIPSNTVYLRPAFYIPDFANSTPPTYDGYGVEVSAGTTAQDYFIDQRDGLNCPSSYFPRIIDDDKGNITSIDTAFPNPTYLDNVYVSDESPPPAKDHLRYTPSGVVSLNPARAVPRHTVRLSVTSAAMTLDSAGATATYDFEMCPEQLGAPQFETNFWDDATQNKTLEEAVPFDKYSLSKTKVTKSTHGTIGTPAVEGYCVTNSTDTFSASAPPEPEVDTTIVQASTEPTSAGVYIQRVSLPSGASAIRVPKGCSSIVGTDAYGHPAYFLVCGL